LHFRVQYSSNGDEEASFTNETTESLIIERPAYFRIHLLVKICVEASIVAIKGSSLANEK